MKVKVNIYNKQKELKIDTEIKNLIKKACRQTLVSENFQNDAEVDVSLVDNAAIKQLNSDYRGIDRETDVLSFPLGSEGEFSLDPQTGAYMLGDIVISVQKAQYQADLYGHSFNREIAFLTVHSALHLLGYDHLNSKAEEKVMFEKQEKILELMGLKVK